jgi:hypothetical protein
MRKTTNILAPTIVFCFLIIVFLAGYIVGSVRTERSLTIMEIAHSECLEKLDECWWEMTGGDKEIEECFKFLDELSARSQKND